MDYDYFNEDEYWDNIYNDEEFHYLNPTFITNFDLKDEVLYKMAIRKSERKDLWIENSIGYTGDKSLHMWPDGDLGEFWELINSIKITRLLDIFSCPITNTKKRIKEIN